MLNTSLQRTCVQNRNQTATEHWLELSGGGDCLKAVDEQSGVDVADQIMCR